MLHNYSISDSIKSSSKITASVVGARGYSGLELVRHLLKHPNVNLTHAFATSSFKFSEVQIPNSKTITCLPDSEVLKHLTDVVFLATPAEVSMALAPEILLKGKIVIDLSGAFRLKTNSYKEWYGFEHTQKQLLNQASYGLTPWRENNPQQKLISNPGCYATSILMALIPLIKENLIDEKQIVIDAKSGTTGAGKKVSESILFSEADSQCTAYKVGAHQHLPEIIEAVLNYTGVCIDPFLSTHLLPVRRGIVSSLYCNLKNGVSLATIEAAFQKYYGGQDLIKFGDLEIQPELLQLKSVVGTAKCHISYTVKNEKLFLFSLIDNLMKGAATQAIENLNGLLGLPQNTALESEAYI